MMPHVLKGDKSLFNRVSDVSDRDYLGPDLQISFCWDVYGLPSGRQNPHHGEMLGPPSEKEINEAFDDVLDETLHGTDKWLMRIPRRIAKLHAFDARVYCTSDGRAAILIPYGIFGGLFLLNEVFQEFKLGARTRLSQKSRREVSTGFHKFLASWVLCLREFDEVTGPVEVELTMLRHVRPVSDRYWIWAFTAVQQVFVILQEFGHLADPHHRDRVSVGPDLLRLAFKGCDAETSADHWAAERIQKGWTNVFPNDPQWISQAIAMLFGIMEVLRKNKLLDVDKEHLVERAWRIHRRIDPLTGPSLPRRYIESFLSHFEEFFFASRQR